MKICIVGGTGNISRSIVELLLEQGHELACFNRGERGDVPDGARQIIGDRNDTDKYESTMQAESFDAAIDMICFSPEQAASSIRAFTGVSHFVMCSTVCTYGIDYDWFPVTEEHPLRPISGYGRGKVAADDVFMAAYRESGFPVTIIKPSTTMGPQSQAFRQISMDLSWIDRIRKGKDIIVSGDGMALHQFMHVKDAAPAFAGVIGQEQCLGEIYNMTKRGFQTWVDYHKAAMKVLGKEVDIIGVPLETLKKLDVPNFGICEDIFAHSLYYCSEKLFRDVPDYKPSISLEDILAESINEHDKKGEIPNSDDLKWEDAIITAQRKVADTSW
ncbi:MAG: NAD-dependent epimerase/dehydratase family protein [Lentisphaeria bacterium]|nr:NAD-dependent epimerase/dehydratase family protein [Lentisphaeria bacterium]NQZ66993.1 NAD-dependent epimerase/dehydratase family protein [Lentisphaeria bacterium]